MPILTDGMKGMLEYVTGDLHQRQAGQADLCARLARMVRTAERGWPMTFDLDAIAEAAAAFEQEMASIAKLDRLSSCRARAGRLFGNRSPSAGRSARLSPPLA
jgi:hypothetical protein